MNKQQTLARRMARGRKHDTLVFTKSGRSKAGV